MRPGPTSKCSDNWAIVRSPLMAASATFALKAGEWFRRGRLFMLSPDSRAQRARCQAETPLIVLSRFPRPALVTLWALSPTEVGLLISAGYIGQLIGSLTIAERFGRRPTLVWTIWIVS